MVGALKRRICWISTISAAVLVSCSSDAEFYKPLHPASQAEAGSVHLAIAPPIPFNSVERALAPEFKLSGDEAVKAALPTTSYSEDHLLQVISLALGLGLPKTSVTGSTTDGSAPEAKPPDRKLTDASRAPLLTGDDKRSIKQDAMLQYSAATALYQEVRLLERYVSYAAQRHGYKPFVLRLSVGLQPFARHQPYDAYATIGFFSTGELSSPARQVTNDADACIANPNVLGLAKRQPYILPLLVTDNLAGTASARSAEMITQIALAISVLAQGVAGNASFGSTREQMRSVLGSDLNALLTVSRSVDNAIQVRLGAATNTVAQYAMIPRNHTITVLMLVPDEQFTTQSSDQPPFVRVMMKTSLRDSVTGTELPFDGGVLRRAILPGLYRAGMNETAVGIVTAHDYRILSALVDFVRTQNGKDFDRCLDQVETRVIEAMALDEAKINKRSAPTEVDRLEARKRAKPIYYDSVWMALAEVQSKSNYQTASVFLCNPEARSRNGFPCKASEQRLQRSTRVD